MSKITPKQWIKIWDMFEVISRYEYDVHDKDEWKDNWKQIQYILKAYHRVYFQPSQLKQLDKEFQEWHADPRSDSSDWEDQAKWLQKAINRLL